MSTNQQQSQQAGAGAGAAARFYCHECQYEGVPLRVPDPQCSECHSDFVEEIESSTNDDPREFDRDDFGLGNALFAGGGAGAGGAGAVHFNVGRAGPGGLFVQVHGGPPPLAQQGAGAEQPFAVPGQDPDQLLRAMMQVFGFAPPPNNPNGMGDDDPGDPAEEELGPGARIYGNPNRGGQGGEGPIRNLAAFLGEAFGARQPHPADNASNNPFAEGGAPPDPDPEPQQQQPMNYLYSLIQGFMGGRGVPVGGAGGAANVGDFAWGDQGFQQILNDLMEQAAGRNGPQPADKELIDGLPHLTVTKEVLDLATIQDCAICKDEFELDNTLITLPCRHAFHEECIVQWLEQSGTCPVCRHHLVPQPGDENFNPNPAPNAPPEPRRQASTSSNPMSPSTARIPEIDGGSRLPGSFPFPESSFGGRRDREQESDGEEVVMEDVD